MGIHQYLIKNIPSITECDKFLSQETKTSLTVNQVREYRIFCTESSTSGNLPKDNSGTLSVQ